MLTTWDRDFGWLRALGRLGCLLAEVRDNLGCPIGSSQASLSVPPVRGSLKCQDSWSLWLAAVWVCCVSGGLEWQRGQGVRTWCSRPEEAEVGRRERRWAVPGPAKQRLGSKVGLKACILAGYYIATTVHQGLWYPSIGYLINQKKSVLNQQKCVKAQLGRSATPSTDRHMCMKKIIPFWFMFFKTSRPPPPFTSSFW